MISTVQSWFTAGLAVFFAFLGVLQAQQGHYLAGFAAGILVFGLYLVICRQVEVERSRRARVAAHLGE